MSKKLLLLPVLGLLFLASCEETPPYIDFSGARAEDTTYLAAAPETPQQRRVLMEEFTGVSCPPCPNGHIKIAAIETQYPERFIAVGFSPFGVPQAEPVHNLSQYDFRTQEGTSLKGDFGVANLPAAVIDRVEGGTGYTVDVLSWSSFVDTRMAVPTKVNLHLSSVYNPGTREAEVTVRAHYTAGVSGKQVLTLLLLENNIVDAQKNGLNIDTFYNHKHVFRKMYTPYVGSPMIDSIANKEPGRVYERRFKIQVDQAWNPDNCKLVAYISNNEPGDKEVQQAEEIKLKP